MRKSILLLVSFLFCVPCYGITNAPKGDINGDGSVNIGDVTELIDYLLESDVTGTVLPNADIDEDGIVSISDVVDLIDLVLVEEENPEYVDLGLPSGTIWATKNIGANSPEEYGNYFAWGETAPKEVYNWDTYKWCNGSSNKLTKYCTQSSYGRIDNKMELDPEDDAAYVNWGPMWRMPSISHFSELESNCTRKWTTINGVSGCMFTSKKNGKTLFFPGAGYRTGSSLNGSRGCYWSRTLSTASPNYSGVKCHCAGGYNIFSSGSPWLYYFLRSYGYTVRPVRISQD